MYFNQIIKEDEIIICNLITYKQSRLLILSLIYKKLHFLKNSNKVNDLVYTDFYFKKSEIR